MKKNIKKGKTTMVIIMSLVCFVLVMVMFMQFKIVNETDITSIENMRETELRTELANWKTKYEEINQKYEETQAKINEYKQTKQSNEETGKVVDTELQQVNISLGKTDLEGKGIEVVIRETNNEDVSKITADDLIIIVNALRLSGAEAISINDERILNMTDIVEINQAYIKINGQRILAPYVIKAIGDQSYLESGLIGNGGYVDEMKKIGQDVSINKINKVKVNKYNGDIKTKYIK